MEIKASATYLRISPRKLRLLTKGLRGLAPQKALEKLQFYPQRGKEFLVKVIKQALANAKNNFKISEDAGLLRIKEIQVGDGPSFKRLDKSHGARFDRGIIKKRTAHLFLTLETKEKINPKELGDLKTKKKSEEKSIAKPEEKQIKHPVRKTKSKETVRKIKRSKNGAKS